MILAHWCVLIAIFLPYIGTAYAKLAGGYNLEDNREPRAFMAKLHGKPARAAAAQDNGFEMLPGFAAAVIIASSTHNATDSTINTWAVIFIISRLIYTFCYIQDISRLRSLAWGVGIICIIGLFISAS